MATVKIEENPVLTAAELRMRTVRELTVIARDLRIQGWHDMRKEALIQSILGSISYVDRDARQENDRSAEEGGKAEREKNESNENSGKSKKEGEAIKSEASGTNGASEATNGKGRTSDVALGVIPKSGVTGADGPKGKGKTSRKKRGNTVDLRKSVSEEKPAASDAVSGKKPAASENVATEALASQTTRSPQVTIRVRSYSHPTDPAAQPNLHAVPQKHPEKTAPCNNAEKPIPPVEPLGKSPSKESSESKSEFETRYEKGPSSQPSRSENVSVSADAFAETLAAIPTEVVARITTAREPRSVTSVTNVPPNYSSDIPSAVRPSVSASLTHSSDSSIVTTNDRAESTGSSTVSSSAITGGSVPNSQTPNSTPLNPQTQNPPAPSEPVHVRKFHRLQASLSRSRDLASGTEDATSDQLFLRASGAFWLEASWTIRRATVERARAALAHLWHESRPVLRLSEIVGDGTNTTVRRMVTTVEIQGGVNRWYLNVDEPPHTFQVEVGYLDPGNRFIGLVKSNLITTSPDAESPVPGRSASQQAAEEEELNTSGVGSFEDRLRRSLGPGLRQPFTWTPGRFLYGEGEGPDYQGFHFEVDAALVVYGATDPGVRLSVRGNPVRIQTDGTFMMRFSLPNRRQVIPIVARSLDGLEQRTVIIAVERNTKVMEPILCDPGDGNE